MYDIAVVERMIKKFGIFMLFSIYVVSLQYWFEIIFSEATL